MNIAAFILIVLAIAVMLYDAVAAPPVEPRRVVLLPLGLALFASAYAVQLLWPTVHIVHF